MTPKPKEAMTVKTIRVPSFAALTELLAGEDTAAIFRYGSSRNVLTVTRNDAQAIVDFHRKLRNDTVGKSKVERMVAGSVTEFQKVLARCEGRTLSPVRQSIGLGGIKAAAVGDSAFADAFRKAKVGGPTNANSRDG